eukprot:CAMPEP_0194027868 /NCGR_PEP_ID=MMETSP0009_2-20130614/1908_1 /TAXON_ID=210454 /ORGANISM="Grammatophora oceanica, Strain CCMP 410" /LENGTH=248 /DNA_ID=CAMNT_0038667053 /DNA_START=129 /DNA_END=875 /DNA_ORIENTATION=+
MSASEPLNDPELGGGGGLPPEPAEKGALKPIAETTPMERVAGGVAIVAVATSLAAIIINQSAVVILAGIFSSAMGPYAYYQQTRLTDIKALQDTHEAVQEEVDRLHASNERLGKNVNELTATVDRLEEVEQALDTISKTQGKSVNQFAEQVEKNKSILKTMQANLKGTVLQNLLSIVMSSDADKDNIVDAEEVDTMIRRIEGISGVEVHDDRFRKAFSGNSVGSLMNVVSNLLRDDVPAEEKIFELKG